MSISWIIDFDAAKSLFASTVTMKFSTSVSFLAAGLSLFAISRYLSGKQGSHTLSEIILPSALLVILLFMTTHITSIFMSTQSGLDNLFVQEGPDALYTVSPGRPSLGTIASFMVIVVAGVATLTVAKSTTRRTILLGCGMFTGFSGTLAVAGYVLSLPLLYYTIPDNSTAMAFHTAILFVIFGFTLAFLTKRQANMHVKSIEEKKARRRISIRTRLATLFLVVSVIPILFVGSILLNNAKTLPNDVLVGSVLVIGFTAMSSAALFALILSRSISNPIRSLQKAANLVAAGDYATLLPIENPDEIGELAADFAKMKETIASNNKNLERLVELRTVELAESNKQLELTNKQLTMANERFQLQDQQMKDFVNVAAHELRNPIAPILMTASLLEGNAEWESSDKITLAKDEFSLIIRNAERLKRLAEDILDVTRIESQSLKLRKERFDLSSLLILVIEDSRKFCKSNRIKICYEASTTVDGAIIIDADKDKIVQVMSNILINATKFTTEGTITVSAQMDYSGNHAVVNIKDDGKGIDPEIVPYLFTKFVTKSQKGMGLGLFISKSIVEAHGGKIWAKNNEDGKGATFTFSLPIAAAHFES